jgi:hypothetical protein
LGNITHDKPIRSIHCAPDGQTICFVDQDMQIYVINQNCHSTINSLDTQTSSHVARLACQYILNHDGTVEEIHKEDILDSILTYFEHSENIAILTTFKNRDYQQLCTFNAATNSNLSNIKLKNVDLKYHGVFSSSNDSKREGLVLIGSNSQGYKLDADGRLDEICTFEILEPFMEQTLIQCSSTIDLEKDF